MAGSPADAQPDLRRQALVAVSITCDGPNCWNTKRVLFEALALADMTPVADSPRWPGFRCQKMWMETSAGAPDWTDHVAEGNGRQIH